MPTRTELEAVGVIVLLLLLWLPWGTLIRWAREELKRPTKEVLLFRRVDCGGFERRGQGARATAGEGAGATDRLFWNNRGLELEAKS